MIKDTVFYKSALQNFNDDKWSRPDVKEKWTGYIRMNVEYLSDESEPKEDRVELSDTIFSDSKERKFRKYPEAYAAFGDWVEYEASGCPEEEKTSVPLDVYVPKKMPEEGKRGAMLYIPGGALVMAPTFGFDVEPLAMATDAVVVCPHYRTAVHAKYPAAINDLHAGYLWILDHADEMGIDTDKIIVVGESSGGHLSLSLGFRLKRYGITPRAIVAGDPITDDRPHFSHKFMHDAWDGELLRATARLYLGKYFGSVALSPEAFPNRCTVEDCIGYPPVFLQACEIDPDFEATMEFVCKLHQAGVFTELHQWGGTCHSILNLMENKELDIIKRYDSIFIGNIKDSLTFDLRRPWTVE